MSGPGFSEAAARNRGPILDALRPWLADRELAVLEIGAGTGQHAAYFAAALPRLRWQPADLAGQLPGLRARVAQYAGDNLRAPLELDVDRFPEIGQPDAIYTANTLHIMSWQSVCTMLRELGRRLRPGALLLIYGPFNVGGRFTSRSNADFDASLRARDPAMGIRGREPLCVAADRAGFSLLEVRAMPANNQLLVLGRRA